MEEKIPLIILEGWNYYSSNLNPQCFIHIIVDKYLFYSLKETCVLNIKNS